MTETVYEATVEARSYGNLVSHPESSRSTRIWCFVYQEPLYEEFRRLTEQYGTTRDNAEINFEIIIRDINCPKWYPYTPFMSPKEHLSFDRSEPSDTQEELEYDVFISHSNEDDELAQRIKFLLEASGIHTFATPSSIPSGLWNPQIERALQQSQHLWLLLTPEAIERSIWSHQEFGYFYGYKRSLDLNDADQRLHYFEVEGNSLRPGMYAHFQATPVPSFDDPIALARIIAESLGKTLNEPKDKTVEENYVDTEGKFVWVEGEVTFNFGKHKGRILKEVAKEYPDYLEWFLHSDFSPDAREIVHKALSGKFP